MTAPLSGDLRERIAGGGEGESSIRAAALRFEVSPSAAIKLMPRVRQTGSLSPGKIGGHRRPILEPHVDSLRAIVSEKAGITLSEIQAALLERGIIVKALSTISEMLHRLGLSHKKSRSEPPSRACAAGLDAAGAAAPGHARAPSVVTIALSLPRPVPVGIVRNRTPLTPTGRAASAAA